jgi:hypothetical protein
MSITRKPVSLLHRLRAMPALRVLLVVAAILASQNSLACALEEFYPAPPVESAWMPAVDSVAPGAPADGGCCAFCTDCAHSGGGCCAVAATTRQGGDRVVPAPRFATRAVPFPASVCWTPPTLLRPPILPG